MTEGHEAFLALPQRVRQDVVETAASRRGVEAVPALVGIQVDRITTERDLPQQAWASCGGGH